MSKVFNALFLLIFIAAPLVAQQNDDLVSWWKFDDIKTINAMEEDDEEGAFSLDELDEEEV